MVVLLGTHTRGGYQRQERGDRRGRRCCHPPRIPDPPAIARIVSGGQTGVDRAALDHAVARGLPYGGWCPAGGWAEDLPQPPGLLARYPALRATPSADPAQRTMWNVRDSDATLVLLPAGLAQDASRGTHRAVADARRLGRPLLVLRLGGDAARDRAESSAFTAGLPPGATLNVAGPRESEAPGVYAAARTALAHVIG